MRGRFQFRGPSVWRVLWSIVGVTVLCGIVAGIVLYANAIITHSDPEPTPTGDYIRLFLLDITFWGPMLLLTIWQVSVPVILVLGGLVASLRRTSREVEPATGQS